MTGTVTDRVRAIAADLFDVPLEEITPESSQDTIEAWDSVQHLNLTLDLEMTFDVKFTPQDIQAMTSIAAVVSAVEHKLSTSPAVQSE